MAHAHRIRWFARVTPYEEAPDGYLPRTSSMVGSGFGWDARCSCGWGSRTGGAIQQRVREAIADHKWEVENGFWEDPELKKVGFYPMGVDQWSRDGKTIVTTAEARAIIESEA